MPDNKDILDISIPLEVNRIIPDDVTTHFVQNIVVQHRPDHFIISFFQTWDPIFLDMSEEERRKKIEEMGSIDSRCVSRIVVTPKAMNAFVGAMQENLGTYEDRYGQGSDMKTENNSAEAEE